MCPRQPTSGDGAAVTILAESIATRFPRLSGFELSRETGFVIRFTTGPRPSPFAGLPSATMA